MKIKWVFIFLIFIFLSIDVLAAEILTWRNCVEEAAKNNPALFATRSQVRASSAQVGAAAGSFFPQVTTHGAYQYRGSSSSVFSTGVLGISGNSNNRTSSSVSVTASQNIFSGFENIGQVSLAQANRTMARLDLKKIKAQVSRDLKASFAQVLFAQKSLHLSDQIIKRRRDNLNMVELRFESGNENKGSALLAEANLREAEYQRRQAEYDIELARQNLARVLGRESLGNVTLVGSVPVSSQDVPDEWLKLALDTPEVGVAKAQVRGAESQVTVARAGYFPRLDLSATLSQRLDNGRSHDAPEWLTGADVTFPLFDGLRTHFNTQSARASRQAARSNQENILHEKIVGLKEASFGFQEALQRVQVDSEYLKAVRIRAEISGGRYHNGLLAFENWDIIENDLINRERAFLQSELNRIVAEADWELAQGKGVIP